MKREPVAVIALFILTYLAGSIWKLPIPGTQGPSIYEQQAPIDAQGNPSQYPEPATPVIVQNPVTVILQPNAEENRQNRNDNFYQWATFLVAFAAACFAMGGFRATKQQAQAARDMLQLALRPKLIVRNFAVRVDQETEYGGFFYAVNIGNSDAVIREIVCHVVIANDGVAPMRRTHDDTVPALNPARLANPLLKPGEERAIVIPFEVKPTASQYRSIANLTQFNTANLDDEPNIAVFIAGHVAYTDKLSVLRRTAFCRQFDYATRRFVPVNDADYEYAD